MTFSFDCHLILSLLLAFGNCSKGSKHKKFHCHHYVLQLSFLDLWQDAGICLFFHFSLFSLYSPLEWPNPLNDNFFFFLIINTTFGILARICQTVWIFKSQSILCVQFSKTDTHLYIHHLSSGQILVFLHNSQWIIFPIES